MAYDVFISYAHEDKATADAVCATLESRDIRCWIAPRDITPGQDYAAAIVQALAEARLFVLVFSARSNASEHVKNEVEKVVSRGIPVIPFRIEDVVPEGALSLHLARRHWLDAMTPPLQQHLNSLAQSIALLLSVELPAPVAPQPPPPAAKALTVTIPVEQIKRRVAAVKFTPAMRRGLAIVALVAVLGIGLSFGLKAYQRHDNDSFPSDEAALPDLSVASQPTDGSAQPVQGNTPEPASTRSSTPPPAKNVNFKIETWSGKWCTAEKLELDVMASAYGDIIEVGQGTASAVRKVLLRDIRRASFVFGDEAKGHKFSNAESSSIPAYVYITTKTGNKIEGTWESVPMSEIEVDDVPGVTTARLQPTDIKTVIVK